MSERVVSSCMILSRGFRHRCPNCGESGLFQKGLRLYRTCPVCGLHFERSEGCWLGSMTINYGVTVFGYLPLVLIAYLLGWVGAEWAMILGLVGALFFPLLFYRTSRSLWLMAYFYFLPNELPANREDGRDSLDSDPDSESDLASHR